jgi:hypothetical protein
VFPLKRDKMWLLRSGDSVTILTGSSPLRAITTVVTCLGDEQEVNPNPKHKINILNKILIIFFSFSLTSLVQSVIVLR